MQIKNRSLATLVALTMLLLATATAGAGVIVDQSSGATGKYIQSQDYTNVPQYSAYAFDDFTIGATYRITSFRALGREYYGNSSFNLAVVGGIYAAPDLLHSPILSTSGVQVGNDLVFDFGGASLPAGRYWVGAYVVRPNSLGGWYWNLRRPVGASQAKWFNPGGAHGYGESPVPLGNVLEESDLTFVLEGDPAPPPPTFTATPTSIPAPASPTWTTGAVPATNTPAAIATSTPTRSATSASAVATSTRTRTRTRTPTPVGGANEQGGNGGQGNQGN